MANRSDFSNASLPRSIKRFLALHKFANAHERGEATRMWVEVHNHHRRVRNQRLAARDTSIKADAE